MKRPIALLSVLVAMLTATAPAIADERILRFDSDMAIQADGSLLVTETIHVRAEGTNIRRGIYRDFPMRYRDRYGNKVEVAFELLGVERDGHSEPNFTERVANGIRVNTGNDTFLPTPGEFTFSIRYRTTRQLGFFPDHDELYWNVTGLGWSFPIDEVHARVALPSPVESAALRLDGYTGRGGERGQDYSIDSGESGVAVFQTTRSLAPREGLTIAVGFPKGIVQQPTVAKRTGWFLRDNLGVLVALAGLILLALFYMRRWTQVGVDPPAGPVFPHYQPPQGFAPGELRMMRRMSNDQRCFSADVVDMGVRGFLQIHQGHGSEGWRLVREPHASLDLLSASQRALATRLFQESGEIELKNTEATRVSGALAAHAAEMSKRLKPRYFKSNGGTVAIGTIASLLVGVIAVLLSGGNGIPVLVVLAVLGLVMHGVFAWLLKAPTDEGRKLLDEIEGLRMYLGVAERDELKSLPGPGPGRPPAMDAKRYEALLPYAMALEVEEAWTSKFTAAVGSAMAQQSSPTWYHGGSLSSSTGLASIGNSLGSALTQQISASSTPPGSSSGGGGGGFSGGGGGGGGGGGR